MKTAAPKSTKPRIKFHSGERLKGSKSVEIYLVTCGTEFVMASDRRDRVDTYVGTYNRLREKSTPEAVIRAISIDPHSAPIVESAPVGGIG